MANFFPATLLLAPIFFPAAKSANNYNSYYVLSNARELAVWTDILVYWSLYQEISVCNCNFIWFNHYNTNIVSHSRDFAVNIDFTIYIWSGYVEHNGHTNGCSLSHPFLSLSLYQMSRFTDKTVIHGLSQWLYAVYYLIMRKVFGLSLRANNPQSSGYIIIIFYGNLYKVAMFALVCLPVHITVIRGISWLYVDNKHSAQRVKIAAGLSALSGCKSSSWILKALKQSFYLLFVSV